MSWRPLPGQGGEREPRRLGESLDGFARRLGVPETGALGLVFQRWEEVVGPSVAAHVTPVSLVQGVLKVAVEDPAWATQFKFVAPGLLARLANDLGDGVVERVEVRVERSRGRSGGRGRGS
jgi:predicted nucleic acid-binding Zn ribbon protein